MARRHPAGVSADGQPQQACGAVVLPSRGGGATAPPRCRSMAPGGRTPHPRAAPPPSPCCAPLTHRCPRLPHWSCLEWWRLPGAVALPARPWPFRPVRQAAVHTASTGHNGASCGDAPPRRRRGLLSALVPKSMFGLESVPSPWVGAATSAILPCILTRTLRADGQQSAWAATVFSYRTKNTSDMRIQFWPPISCGPRTYEA